MVRSERKLSKQRDEAELIWRARSFKPKELDRILKHIGLVEIPTGRVSNKLRWQDPVTRKSMFMANYRQTKKIEPGFLKPIKDFIKENLPDLVPDK